MKNFDITLGVNNPLFALRLAQSDSRVLPFAINKPHRIKQKPWILWYPVAHL